MAACTIRLILAGTFALIDTTPYFYALSMRPENPLVVALDDYKKANPDADSMLFVKEIWSSDSFDLTRMEYERKYHLAVQEHNKVMHRLFPLIKGA